MIRNAILAAAAAALALAAGCENRPSRGIPPTKASPEQRAAAAAATRASAARWAAQAATRAAPAGPDYKAAQESLRKTAAEIRARRSGKAPTTRPADLPPPLPAPDERTVAAVIDDLGSADFAVRQAGSDRLKAMGPELIPALQKHLEHDDPEVKARVAAVINSFGWMRQGAIIVEVRPGGRGEAVGLRLGDVIVKVNDADIVVHTDVAGATEANERNTWHIWRDGRVRTFEAAEGKLGIFFSNWDLAKGGNDHARGLAALAQDPPDRDEAYRRLRAAQDQGMDDSRTFQTLAGLAARALDRRYATDTYLAYRHTSGSCRLTHDDTDDESGHVPVNSPHTEWLLGQYREAPFSPRLYHELEDWFARRGRNGPLAAELVAKPWPHENAPDSQRNYHDLARMMVWMDQRRYEEALAVWEAGVARKGSTTYNRSVIALQAAVGAGRAQDAARIGLRVLDPATRNEGYPPDTALYGFALAAAAGDAAAADGFLAGLDRLGPDVLAEAEKLRSVNALYHPAAADRVRAWLAGRPRPAKPGRFEHVALARLVSDPATTPEQFAAATAGYQVNTAGREYDLTVLTGQMRFGQYDLVDATLQGGRRANPAFSMVHRRASAAIAFARARAAEIAGPWKELKGLIEVGETPDDGTTWVLRYDGTVFAVDWNKKLLRFGGLAAPPAPVTIAYPHLRVRPDSVAVTYPYGRAIADRPNLDSPDVVYVLDRKRNRWVPANEAAGWTDLHNTFTLAADTTRVAAARAAAKGHPPLPGAPREPYVYGDRDFHRFEGDVVVHVDPGARRVVDLSIEIGRLAGRTGPARVYALAREDADENRRLLCSDSGLWAVDVRTSGLTRVPLGLPDENVMTVRLPEELYGRRADGTVLVGVAPQQGGQVFVVDPKTLAVTPTDGYCGLGPDDYFAYRAVRWQYADPQPAIHARYLARLAAGGK